MCWDAHSSHTFENFGVDSQCIGLQLSEVKFLDVLKIDLGFLWIDAGGLGMWNGDGLFRLFDGTRELSELSESLGFSTVSLTFDVNYSMVESLHVLSQ